ncbi:MAG: glycosyltransferase [Micrococcales bacterium]
MSDSVWIILPSYNEAENLVVVVPQIIDEMSKQKKPFKVLVFDDGSSDNTAEVMAGLQKKHKGLLYEGTKRNRGKAAALQNSFEMATAANASIVIMMDADGQDDPKEIVGLIHELESGADLVTGARMTRNDRFIKRNTSKIYNAATSKLAGVPGKDFNSGFKVMTGEVAAAVSPMLYGEMHRYLTVIAYWNGFTTREKAVEHHARLAGKSKYGIARFWRGFIDLLTVRFLMSYESRPSHLFGAFGVSSLLIGLAILAYLTFEKIIGHGIGERPLLIAGLLFTLVGIQLLIFGLLAELIVFSRKPRR